MSGRRLTRGARKLAIVQVLWKASEPMTFREITRAMGMKASPHVRVLLDELVGAGLVCQTADVAANGAPRFLFQLR